MVQAKYLKDYKYNYLILKCEGIEGGYGYQQKMLASNKIERILKCSVRNINGAAYFYYDISSKVTLENLYQRKQMTYEQVKDFLEQMDVIYGNLADFFLEEAGLLLQPEYIYYDFSSGKYYGLYYPREIEEGINLYEPLMDFLLNHIDNNNQELADKVYRIYEMSEDAFFSLADALALFEDGEEKEYRTEKRTERERSYDREDAYLFAEKSLEEIQNISQENLSENKLENDVSRERKQGQRNCKEQGANIEKNSIFYGIFALLSLCGMGGEVWIYWEYELTEQELLMILCCGVVTLLCFLFSLVQCLLSGKRIKKQEKEDMELQREIEDEFRELRPVALEGVLDRDMCLSMLGNPAESNHQGVREENRKEDQKNKWQRIPDEERYDDRNEETVFIDLRKTSQEYKLYALDKKNKRHIELTKFPFTIGKMAGYVDCALADDSVSRLHARIEKRENKLYLTDMNSTNGTYKNGLRMEPSETVELEPGDEIRFGKLNYCYR